MRDGSQRAKGIQAIRLLREQWKAKTKQSRRDSNYPVGHKRILRQNGAGASEILKMSVKALDFFPESTTIRLWIS
jgi:hypothetical protein